MKITSITCENFRCWKDLTLDLPETISVFVGKNGAGKSSLIDALRACLTGTARGVARGDASDLATWGTTSWAVELGLLVGEAPGRIRRTSTTLSAVRPTGEKIKITQEQLAARIGDAQTLDAILDTGRALEMSAGDRKALVYRLAKIAVDDAALAAAGLTLDDVRGAALDGDWRKAERLAAERKRSANRAAEEMRTGPVEDPVCGTIRASEVTDDVLTASRKKLEDLVADDRALVESIGRAKGAAAVSVSALEEQREKAAGELAAMKLDEAEAALAKVRAAIPGAIARAKEMFDTFTAVETDEREKREAAERAEDALDELRSATREHSCPTCGHSHVAPQIPTSEEIAAAERALQAYREVARVATDSLEPAQQRMRETDITVRKLEAEDKRLLEQLAPARAARKTVERLDKEIAAAKKAASSGAADILGMEQRLASLRQRQETGRQLLAAVDTHRKARAAADATGERIAALRQEAAACEAQEHLCRPDGLQQKLLAPALAPIRARLALWTELLGYELVLGEDFEVGVRVGEGVARVSMLSKSERWRAGIALADALAQLSGLRWLVLDDAEQLDGGRRAELIGLLAGISGDYDQVLVAGVIGDREPRQAPEGSGVRVYVVGEGKVEPVAELAEVAR